MVSPSPSLRVFILPPYIDARPAVAIVWSVVQLEIRIYGDPVLRKTTTDVPKVDDAIRQLAADMIETMHAAEGVGLAAPQVGRTESLCVVEAPDEYDQDESGQRLNPDLPSPLVLVNPRIVSSSRKTDGREEGCLSIPDIRAQVQRPLDIVVRYRDEHGVEQERAVKGFVARIIQHEIDHLHGVLFVDKVSAAKKLVLKSKLRKMREETERRMGLA
jgi:peptide deformylase